MIGSIEALTGSFQGGVYFLAACIALSACTVLRLGLGRAQPPAAPWVPTKSE